MGTETSVCGECQLSTNRIYPGCLCMDCFNYKRGVGKTTNINFDETPKPIPFIKEFNFYPENDFEMAISELCDEIKETLIKKNRDYGDSFRKIYEEYGEVSLLIRLSDKLERLKSLHRKENLVKDESKRDTRIDIAGYSLLTEALERVNSFVKKSD